MSTDTSTLAVSGNHHDRFRYNLIPPHMMAALVRYIETHEPVGDFLYAVLTNNLRDACHQADDTNLWLLPIYMSYLYNEAPSPCWGSKEKVDKWLAAWGAK